MEENSELFLKLADTGIILTEKNVTNEIIRIKKKNVHLLNGPSLHIVIPTLKCNHRCVYCHAGASNCDEKDMNEETAKKTIDFIFQSSSKYITIEFQGGEPLLRFDMIKTIHQYALKLNKTNQKKLLFTIVTNLSLMDEEKLKYCIDNEIDICTSLDGPEEIHNYNRKLNNEKGSYELVNKWIKHINEEYKKRKIKNRRINALITITKKSLSHSKEIIDEYLNQGMQDIHLRFLNNLGDAREAWNDISYTPEEFIKFWKESMDYIIKLNMEGKKLHERGAIIFLKKILTEHDPNFLDIRSPCGACIGQIAYTPNGKIFSCDEARMLNEDLFKIGEVDKNSMKEVLGCNKTCSIISSSINDAQICDACAYKPYCGLCPVCNYAEKGSLIAKIPETARCKIFKAQLDYLFEKLQDKKIKKIFENWITNP
ncbi:MAG: His-Xaa-Ser system radical SAM maturase HxsB [Candidatus Peregrinibacteria bacterium]|nr:His-Xaa-Ser system radical SAM maturase HxsB [Candidatus Peregrinibacteria bacterium]